MSIKGAVLTRQDAHRAYRSTSLTKGFAMPTVPETIPSRNPKAFYATFHGLSGVLTKPADRVLFLEHESGRS